MSHKDKNSAAPCRRRSFVKALAGFAAIPCVIPGRALGLNGAVAPSNRIALGFIGLGAHGFGVNLKSMVEQPDVQIKTLCDVDTNHLKKAVDYVREKTAEQLAGHNATGDWRDVITRPDVDAVVVSTPDHWHVPIALAAIRAGKDVLCEKPTLTIREGQLLSETVRRYGRVFQTSTEDRGVPVYHRMAELVRNGRIGKLQTIRVSLPGASLQKQDAFVPLKPSPVPPELDYEMWLGPAPFAPYQPERVHYHWRWNYDYSGGMLADWGTHQCDTAQWANDSELTGPVEVRGEGRFLTGLYNTADFFKLDYRYANGVQMAIQSGGTGLRFEGSAGWVESPSWRAPLQASRPAILNSIIEPGEIHLYTDPRGEHRNFLDCVKSRRDPYFPVEKLHRLSSLLHIGTACLRLGRPLRWDPVAEIFKDDDEANRMRSRAMRQPWAL